MTEAGAFNFSCPSCGEAVEVPGESVGHSVLCPLCDSEFVPLADQFSIAQHGPDEQALLEPDLAFDQLRIEHYTALRMGAIRSRSWWLIVMYMSIVCIVDLVAKSMLFYWDNRSWGIDPTLRCLAAGGLILFAWHADVRARDFKQEIDRSALPQPTLPPDFSSLSDGSDRWKNLENIR